MFNLLFPFIFFMIYIIQFILYGFIFAALIGGVVSGLANPTLGCLADKYYLSKFSTFAIFITSGN
jgi:sodium/bile acid cotransporter 7